MMIEPAIYGKNRTSVELLASVARSLFSAFPPTLAERSNKTGAVGVALKIQSRIRDILNKYLNHVADPSQFSLDFLWYACNCVNVMKSAMEPAPQGMQPVIHSLLKAMNRLAKDHNQQPQAALLSSKGPAKEAPTDADYSTGAWFMFHALSGKWHSQVNSLSRTCSSALCSFNCFFVQWPCPLRWFFQRTTASSSFQLW